MSLSPLTRSGELKHIVIRSPIMTNRRLGSGSRTSLGSQIFPFLQLPPIGGCPVASQCGLIEVCAEIVWLGDLLVRSLDLRGVIPHPQEIQDGHVSNVRPGGSVIPGEVFSFGRFAGQMPEHLPFYLFKYYFFIFFPSFLVSVNAKVNKIAK